MNGAESAKNHRLAKIVLGFSALGCLLTGLVLYSFAERLGFDRETARLVALAFMGAAVIDYIVMRYWDRIVQVADK